MLTILLEMGKLAVKEPLMLVNTGLNFVSYILEWYILSCDQSKYYLEKSKLKNINVNREKY